MANSKTFLLVSGGSVEQGIESCTDEGGFMPSVLRRQTPRWAVNSPTALTCKCGMKSLAVGKLPIGILPPRTIVRSTLERKRILRELMQLPETRYKGVSDDQCVRCWGSPFVDAKTVSDHLSTAISPAVVALTSPLLQNLTEYLVSLGFDVQPMIDPVTLIPYPAGIFRAISVVNEASVLHTDDFVRDGLQKPDFRLPEVLVGRQFTQLSFNILLDDGGFEPDALWVYNRFHTPADEVFVMKNGWQFPLDLVSRRPSCKYTPSVGSEYAFCTTNYHDVRGGSPRANRVTFSVFAIYVPSLNLMMLYN